MHRLLRLCCLALAVATVVLWAATGARVGWWQTRVGVERTDEVTGLSVIEWQDRFVPGVETPLIGLLSGGALFGATFLLRRKLPNQPSSS